MVVNATEKIKLTMTCGDQGWLRSLHARPGSELGMGLAGLGDRKKGSASQPSNLTPRYMYIYVFTQEK